MYIPIERIEESEESALYAFKIEEFGWGRFRIDRQSGTAELEEAPSAPGLQRYFDRASGRVRHLLSEGTCPVRTCWSEPA